MRILRNFGLVFSLFLFSVASLQAGPANKMNADRLVNSYLIVEQLASDGNQNALSNKKTMYSFLNEDQKDLVNKIISLRENERVRL
tara:strand:+ start:1958 stop:2215 length:258 start_codon:yes stop_codon:yes gene_type:complete